MHKIQPFERPFTLIKTAISLDGCIDDTSAQRLILSNQEDRDLVDALKSTFDAILVGAQTVRKDNPSLLIKAKQHRNERLKRGLPEHPRKVTMTLKGDLDPNSRFFQEGSVEKIVYCLKPLEGVLRDRIGHVATVVGLVDRTASMINPQQLLADLSRRGVSRLMIEGGGSVNHLFLKQGLVDSMRVAVAPFFVGERHAPRLISSEKLSQNKGRRMKLSRVESLGDRVILHYQLKLQKVT